MSPSCQRCEALHDAMRAELEAAECLSGTMNFLATPDVVERVAARERYVERRRERLEIDELAAPCSCETSLREMRGRLESWARATDLFTRNLLAEQGLKARTDDEVQTRGSSEEFVFVPWCSPCPRHEAEEWRRSALDSIRQDEACLSCGEVLTTETWCVCQGQRYCRTCHESAKVLYDHSCTPPSGTLVVRKKGATRRTRRDR